MMRAVFISAVLSFLTTLSCRADPTVFAKPLMMGAMGDSITAASLAETPHPTPSTEDGIRAWAAGQVDEKLIYENKLTLSWASGIRVRSHYMRLKEYLKKSGEKRILFAENTAEPGGKSDQLPGQAEELVKKAANYSGVKYVTILIGSNDACSKETQRGTPLPRIRANILAAFKKLAEIRQDEPIRVLLVGIPRIPELADPGFREARTIFGMRCEKVRNEILHFCDPLLLWKTPEEYDRKMAIVEGINALLRSVAIEAKHDFVGLDVAYSDALSNNNIPLNVMAADCFHPGKLGHERLAEETWLDQPWFN